MENLALHLFNLKQYYRMVEVGVLPENASLELLNCQVIDMPDRKSHRFSVKDYYRLAETGVLRPGERVELLDGNIIDMAPIGPLHAGLVMRFNRLLHECAKDRWLISVHNPVRLGDYSEPEPDLMLLRPSADDYCSRHPVPGDVFLLIEVSDSTLETDRDVKLPVYARAGVAEVWIVDLVNGTLEVYRQLQANGYASTRILHDGDLAAPAHFPDAVIEVTKLLRH